MKIYECKRKGFFIGESEDDCYENLDVDFERGSDRLVYFCGDSFYGYYSYEDFDKLIEYLNQAWKKAKEFINEHGSR